MRVVFVGFVSLFWSARHFSESSISRLISISLDTYLSLTNAATEQAVESLEAAEKGEYVPPEEVKRVV